MIQKLINKVFGDPVQKEISQLQKIVDKINQIENEYQSLTDDELRAKVDEFRERLKNKETEDDLLQEAFAVVKNACRRISGQKFPLLNGEFIWEMVPYDVQLIGGIVLHKGRIAEMKTGEGKTLVSTLPIFLNALSGKGVHAVTVNDYLARRDREWMKPLFDFLGLTSGVITHDMSPDERKEAYSADITYATNNELGFDFLRDGMVSHLDHMVQRDLHYAIIDEVDSILIDEARTPLIISQPAEESTQKYSRYAQLIQNLQENTHYNIDEKQKTATLTEEGVAKMEELLGVQNIFVDAGLDEVRHIEHALRAKTCYQKDTDYVVKDGEVIIVDEFTGRLMEGRRYSEGLHQAIEAKENVEIKRESRTMATITFQNYFRMYNKLSGMTGTAMTEAEEFAKIYGLDALPIPTNKPIQRTDQKDFVYKNENGKFQAIANEVKSRHEKGQPVLIGTISIEKSEALSGALARAGINHSVLNAKQHEKEAEIVANAGQKGAVTIATNMAGRGTDIKINDEVKALGGLCIIGSERHESRRIDNQLRGRAGRQGDPGESRFFVSLEDPLMRLFGSDKLQNMMNTLNIPDDMPIESRMVSGAIENAQKKVEGRNFDIRKHVVEFDDVTNKHREIVHKRRRKILENKNLHEDVMNMLQTTSYEIVENNTLLKPEEWDRKEIYESLMAIHSNPERLSQEKINQLEKKEELKESAFNYLRSELEVKKADLPDPERFSDVERLVYLHIIDTAWPAHLDEMKHLRETVSLRSYAQKDPLLEFKQEGFIKFKELLKNIDSQTVNALFKVKINIQMPVREEAPKEVNTNQDEIGAQESFKPKKKVKTITRTIKNTSETGRNDPCPCGSGQKYKKCCGKHE
jgi:preprotein translocase subunit SecA